MREILFRGKRVTDGEWVCGSLVHRTSFYGDPCDDYLILTDGEFDCDYYEADRVENESVGQYTGLTDKNGKKIFEGDIVKFRMFRDEPDWIGVVKYDTAICLYMLVGDMPDGNSFEVQVSSRDKKTFEVIGNIWDNPELLETE